MELVELKGHTEGPWQWHAEDASMTTLHGKDYIEDHVMAAKACDACAKRGALCLGPKRADALLIAAAPTLLAIANELANKLAMAGQPAQAFESFASRGIKPPALVMREALGYDEPPTAEGRDGE